MPEFPVATKAMWVGHGVVTILTSPVPTSDRTIVEVQTLEEGVNWVDEKELRHGHYETKWVDEGG